MRRASSANQRNWSQESVHSRPAWAIGLPVSSEIILAPSSARCNISSAARCSASARAKPHMARSFGRAAAAASIASRVSRAVASVTSPRTAPLTGETTSPVAAPASQRPFMKSPKFAYMAYPISLVLTVRPSAAERIAASARSNARRPSSKPTSGALSCSTASTKALISAAKASA